MGGATLAEVKGLRGAGARDVFADGLEHADEYAHVVVVAETLDGFVVSANTPMKVPYLLGLLDLGKERTIRVAREEG